MAAAAEPEGPPLVAAETAGCSAVSWSGKLRAGEISARELLELHVRAIEAANPLVNAIVTLTLERAGEMAAAADAAFARGAWLGPLHGLPVAHKDLALTAGVRTTLGSPRFADFVPEADELLVTRQHAAGAVMVGKTNTPELGAGSHTFNRVFGATRNPYDLARTCGGSSGGAAVALATGMVALADGSDLGGSLRNPAAFCGVVGLRPSPGRVPTWPEADPFASMAVVGPMGRTVEDVAWFLSAIAGPDQRLPLSLQEDPAVFGEPLGRDRPPVRRIAWSPRLGGLPVEAEVVAVLERSLRRFEELGIAVEVADPPLGQSADDVFETLRAVAMAASWGDEIDRAPELFKPTVRWNVAEGRRRTASDVGRAWRQRGAIHAAMTAFWERYDALALPATQVMPFPIEHEYPTVIEGVAMESYLTWMRVCSRVTVTACPAISVPAGRSGAGLPVGLQLVMPARQDRALLELAHAFERTAAG